MITTGIIRSINVSTSKYKGNKYRVELNLFQTPGDLNKDNYTLEANFCHDGAIFSSLKEGDTVYVGFLNNDLSFPIILGKIYKGINNSTCGFANLSDLTVSGSSVFSSNITIGDLSYDDLKNSVKLSKLPKIKYFNHVITFSTDNVSCQVTLLLSNNIKIKDITELKNKIKQKYGTANVVIFQDIARTLTNFSEISYIRYDSENDILKVKDIVSSNEININNINTLNDAIYEI